MPRREKQSTETERGKYKIAQPAVPGFVDSQDPVEAARASEILRRTEWQDKDVDDEDDYGETRGTAELERSVLAEEADLVDGLLQPAVVPQLVPSSVEETNLSELTSNHAKIVALIAHYGTFSSSVDEQETWIRSTALQVMIYEGIQVGVFEFDFSPTSVRVSQDGRSGRVYMNVSQEANGAILDLLEWGIVGCLKMISDQHHMVTAYQATSKGMSYLEQVATEHRDSVSRLVHGPKPYQQELIDVKFDGHSFELTTPKGFSKKSAVTDTEDVSYVTSPYLPDDLRAAWGPALQSNKGRAGEVKMAEAQMRTLSSEEVYLSAVRILAADYVPMDVNALATLASLLGANEHHRVTSTLAEGAITDESSSSSCLRLAAGLSRVLVLDFEEAAFLNLQTHIHFPEDDGIVQVEEFAMNVSVDGSVVTGVKLEAILDRRADRIPLDHLSRMLVDLQMDSARIVQDLCSPIQRQMLSTAFAGDFANRSCYMVLTADAITPKLSVQGYKRRSAVSYELNQVLGTIQDVHELGSEDLLFRGGDAMLLAGPHAHLIESVAVRWAKLHNLQLFCGEVYWRLLQLTDELTSLAEAVAKTQRSEEEEEELRRVPERESLHRISHDCVRVQHLFHQMVESLQAQQEPLPSSVTLPPALSGPLLDILRIGEKRDAVLRHVRSLDKQVQSTMSETTALLHTIGVVEARDLNRTMRGVQDNTSVLEASMNAEYTTVAAVELIQVVMLAILVFNVIDRIGGGSLNLPSPDWVTTLIKRPIMDTPFLWFLVNLALAAAAVSSLRVMHARHQRKREQRASTEIHVRVPIRSVDALDRHVQSRQPLRSHRTNTDTISSLCTARWKEQMTADLWKWGGPPPEVQLTYDRRAGMLLAVCIWLEDPIGVSESAVMRTVLEDLVVAGALRQRLVETVIGDNFNIQAPERGGDDKEEGEMIRVGSTPGSEEAESVSGAQFGTSEGSWLTRSRRCPAGRAKHSAVHALPDGLHRWES